MKEPRFLTYEEEVALASRAGAPEIDVEALIPWETMPISKGCNKIIYEFGPLAEEVLKWAFEFYSEGITIRGDRIIRDVYFPIQEVISPTFFDVTPNMIRECTNYVRWKRKQTGLDWITIASIHGHGKAKVTGAKGLQFSLPDVLRHMDHFLKTQSLPTRQILDSPADLSLMFNDMDIEVVNGDLCLSDGFAYHPILKIMGLPEDQQKAVFKELGIDSAALKGRSALDIMAAYLKQAANFAEQQNRYAISAKQWRVLRYNYFIVMDNYRNHRAEIAVLLEDTVNHIYKTYRKEVPLEPVKVRNDVKYKKKELVERIKTVYAHILKRKETTINVSLKVPESTVDQLWADLTIPVLQDREVRKEQVDKLRPDEVASKFFHSVMGYLDLARSANHKYSGFLSELIKMYCLSTSAIPISYRLADMAPTSVIGNKPVEDHDFCYVNLHLDPLKSKFVTNFLNGLKISKAKEQEISFMRDFAYAPTIHEQNTVIEKYVPILIGLARKNGGV